LFSAARHTIQFHVSSCIFDTLFSEDYEVSFHLKQLTTDDSAAAQVRVRNRRFRYLETVLTDSDYFSEQKMAAREPLLYHEYVGQYKAPVAIPPRPYAGDVDEDNDDQADADADAAGPAIDDEHAAARRMHAKRKSDSALHEDPMNEDGQGGAADMTLTDTVLRNYDIDRGRVRVRAVPKYPVRGNAASGARTYDAEASDSDDEMVRPPQQQRQRSASDSEHESDFEDNTAPAAAAAPPLSSGRAHLDVDGMDLDEDAAVAGRGADPAGGARGVASPEARAAMADDFLRIMKDRFLQGFSEDVDYGTIDGDTALDNLQVEERDAVDKYFDSD